MLVDQTVKSHVVEGLLDIEEDHDGCLRVCFRLLYRVGHTLELFQEDVVHVSEGQQSGVE